MKWPNQRRILKKTKEFQTWSKDIFTCGIISKYWSM